MVTTAATVEAALLEAGGLGISFILFHVLENSSMILDSSDFLPLLTEPIRSLQQVVKLLPERDLLSALFHLSAMAMAEAGEEKMLHNQ